MEQRADQFGNYLLEELIAVGGMAEIFRARRVGAAGFARQVCIKRILPALCSDTVFVNMFIDEARTGAQLRHGNIVAIDDFGEVNGQYYLAMEFIVGIDVSRLLEHVLDDGHAFPIDAAITITAEVLKALSYAHSKHSADGQPLDIVHRDISPHNVLVALTGDVKLTDFGIAKAATRLHHTTGHVIKGKLAYMAPEQARGRPIDGRADLFALGVTLYELLAGRRPFTGNNEGEMVLALVRGQRPRLRDVRPDVPPALEAVVDKLLAVDAAARYATAGDALADLLQATPTPTGPRTLAAMLAHYVKRPTTGRGTGSNPSLPGAPPVSGASHPIALLPTEPATPMPRAPIEPPAPVRTQIGYVPGVRGGTPVNVASSPVGSTAVSGPPVPLSLPPPAPAPGATPLPSAQVATHTHVSPVQDTARNLAINAAAQTPGPTSAPPSAPPSLPPRVTSPHAPTRPLNVVEALEQAPAAPNAQHRNNRIAIVAALVLLALSGVVLAFLVRH